MMSDEIEKKSESEEQKSESLSSSATEKDVSSKSAKANKSSKKAPAAPAKIKAEAKVYIGPTLPGGKLFQFTVFKGGLPVYAQKLVDECSALNFLFVSPSQLSVARLALSDKTSVVASKYKEAAKHFTKGAK